MVYEEIYGDLFESDAKYLAHCVSSDYALGAGIAVQFAKRYNMRNKLKAVGTHKYPDAILIDNVFNLVTKNKYWMKPTLQTLRESLIMMRAICVAKGIKDIAMPKIGAGLDRLAWMHVSEIIKDVFKNTDIRIRVYIL